LGLIGNIFGVLGSFASIAMVTVLTAQVALALKIARAAQAQADENSAEISRMKADQVTILRRQDAQGKVQKEQNEAIEAVNSQIELLIAESTQINKRVASVNERLQEQNSKISESNTNSAKALDTANSAADKLNEAQSIAKEAVTVANEAAAKMNEALAANIKINDAYESLKKDYQAIKAELFGMKFAQALIKKGIADTKTELEIKYGGAIETLTINGVTKDYVTRTVGETKTSFQSDIRDLDDKVVGLESTVKSGAAGVTKSTVEQIVDTKIQAVRQMNEQQASQINTKLDKMNDKVVNFPSVGQIAIAVGALDIFRQILNKPTGGLSKCFAPQVIPPVAAQTRANFVAIGTLQGVTIAQSKFIQTSINAVSASTTIIQKTVTHATYGLQAAHRLAQTAWKATHMDKVLNTLSVVIALHNAAMLSRNLGETLGDLTSQALSTIGIKDTEGNPLNINATISSSVNSMLTNILGAETYQGIKETWNKSSRILSSASTIVWTVRSIADSTREITEWTAENTGKIGNALKRWRVVGENAYSWMPERMTAQNKWLARVERARNGVDNLDDAASSFSSVLGEVQNIQQEYSELSEQGTKFKDNIKQLEPKEREQNEPVQLARQDEREASKSPSSQADVFRGEGESD
jgi:hypothetical protein